MFEFFSKMDNPSQSKTGGIFPPSLNSKMKTREPATAVSVALSPTQINPIKFMSLNKTVHSFYLSSPNIKLPHEVNFKFQIENDLFLDSIIQSCTGIFTNININKCKLNKLAPSHNTHAHMTHIYPIFSSLTFARPILSNFCHPYINKFYAYGLKFAMSLNKFHAYKSKFNQFEYEIRAHFILNTHKISYIYNYNNIYSMQNFKKT